MDCNALAWVKSNFSVITRVVLVLNLKHRRKEKKGKYNGLSQSKLTPW